MLNEDFELIETISSEDLVKLLNRILDQNEQILNTLIEIYSVPRLIKKEEPPLKWDSNPGKYKRG